MNAASDRPLRIALVVFGVGFLFLHPMFHLSPPLFQWQPPQHEYELMIVGIYATLGIFLIWASRRPEAHLSLIWFTIWSSVVHGGIMAVQAIVDSGERFHLIGDVPLLFLVAGVLARYTPRGVTRLQASSSSL